MNTTTAQAIAVGCSKAFGALVLTAVLAAPASAALQVTTNADAGAGSLRQAILASNATPGVDTIEFALAPADLVIVPLSPLPTITDPLILDGTSQPGWSGRPLVEIDGNIAGGQGLFVVAGDSTIAGLAINGFNRGIAILTNGGNEVWGCHIGTDPAGTLPLGNAETGIRISANDNRIGGTTPVERNVIAANGTGVVISSVGSGNVVVGNYIGTTATGADALGNNTGVRVLGETNVIGGSGAGEGNIISANFRGVVLDSDDNTVRGNVIGLDVSGVHALGNSESGVRISGSQNSVGGAESAAGNVIAANGIGVMITDTGSVNSVQGNYIGTVATGASELGNGTGVRVLGEKNVIGGRTAGEGNVISANTRGVTLESLANRVLGNVIGLDPSGVRALGNSESGVRISGSKNTVGGADPGAGNVIAANGSGIIITVTGSLNFVQGNYIGTTASGARELGNGAGIRVIGDANVVGGSGAGEGNVISANGRGVNIESIGNLVLGNVIGLDPSGVHALGNSESGVLISGSGNTVGGVDPGAGNVISANDTGVYIGGVSSNDNAIVGNLIGTGASGAYGRGNLWSGVRVVSGTGNRVGGVDAGAGNVISGNLRGVTLKEDASASIVQGNIIGLDASGTSVVENAETGVGVQGPDNQVGGSAPGAGNVISGNRLYGVVLWGAAASGNAIEGNEIGTVVPGGSPLRNGTAGVRISNAFDNIIGGTAPGAGNVIAGNGSWGVFVESGTGNGILGNSIFENRLLGIDHHLYGPTANDVGDTDFGPNLGQNHPLLESVLASPAETTIVGELASAPNASYRIEFFSSPGCDPSGFGQGRTFLGATTVLSDGTGRAPIDETLPVALTDLYVTATATSAQGDTSEFSPCALVGGPNPGVLQLSIDPFVGWEYDGVVTITVTRSHGLTGTVRVDYATIDDVATAPADYTAVSGALTFGPGEVLKTFDVPVVLDLVPDHGETIGLMLANPTGGATLGRATASLFLADGDPELPTLFFSDAEIVEGDAGLTEASFTVRLSPSTVAVTVDFETVDGTAVAGVDYESTSGQLQFNPGDTEKTILVPVLGDGDPEEHEFFFLRPTGVVNATVTDGVGEGVILDDDTAAPTAPLCLGGTTIVKPRIVLGALGGPIGNERIMLKGDLEFASGSPSGLTTLDAATRGAQVRIEDLGTGAVLFDLTTETHPVPPGAMATSPCDPRAKKKDGWKSSRNQRAYVYQNKTGAFVSDGCAPGSAQGLRRLALKDRRATSGQVRFNLAAQRATLTSPVGPLRMTVVLGADSADGQAGACAVHEFTPSQCRWNRRETKLVCD